MARGEARLAQRRRWAEMELILGSRQSSRVVEPELDMNRRGPRIAGALSRLWELVRLFTSGGRAMGPPMRSVDRELEEAWPRDR